ncbi:N-acetylmuramoyl-L-alanine amidase [Nocardia otitidiscaviarum]|uniref:peptidoglycan recognition protein family protein n=1 Tax=Nocardia otitidiscaviarum TaxID=1823 RepID=UPI001893A238|nr:N-acetylmuramoyl-L-alanine amidase [Nocardia otitidiscaviarum]MBF6133518.1 N-acetylmuramoyl-L-alanine amidase [Nocardia otitidiscaviarum]
MAWTGDPVWLADVLRAAGLRVIEHDGWRERGWGDFGDIRGVLCHHTAGGGENDWRIVQYGRSDLPGPLAQLVLERDGTYRVIAAGVCWHAGRGSWPGWPTNNANYHVIGIEAVNNGRGQPWPEVQLDAYRRGCAAILARIGRSSADCVAHREYSSEGKIDPAGIDMRVFRADVQALIDGNPTTPQGGTGMSHGWGEQILNLDGDKVTREDIVKYTDLHAGLVLDQLGGLGTRRGADFPGWPQLGGRTMVDALAAIGTALGIPGFSDPKETGK